MVLLKHIPDINPSVIGRYDVQLSGHIHGGQIWPFRYFVALQFDYGVGLHPLDEGWLSVSPGTGSWGTPMRVGSPPKIMLIRLVPAE
ncbi:MAG: metallophosphoesterase, partial [Candidatus Sumerlaeota bacterium]